MENEIIEVDGAKWKVRHASCVDEAMTAIVYARCSGSIGGTQIVNGEVVADVVRLNDDGTERKPYGG